MKLTLRKYSVSEQSAYQDLGVQKAVQPTLCLVAFKFFFLKKNLVIPYISGK